ncbi:aminotransferase [Allostella sp. ATCC 35155]|nr:aminotransferase [Stella sp. ATCC 35155]
MAAWTYFEGAWHEGNPKLMGPLTQAAWLCCTVFDGARAFEGQAPDLDLHCQRVIRSAHSLGMKPGRAADEIETIAREGIARFSETAELYIRPMFWAESGGVEPDPDSTQFALAVYESPMPKPTGFSASLSRFRRPSPEIAPTDAKAGCLYPNSARAQAEVRARGFDAAVMLDMHGNVAEFASSNLFIARGGEVHTPVLNGTFLAGITRGRVIELLRSAGVTVHERTIAYSEVMTADEVFSTGNYAKVVPVTRIEERALQPGPFYRQARELYWDYAHGETRGSQRAAG